MQILEIRRGNKLELFKSSGNSFNECMTIKKTVAAEVLFRAFSDRIRMRILHLLQGGELCVCDLVEIVGVPQPTASRHLAYLRKAGLVATEKRGLWTFYSLKPARTRFHTHLYACLAACLEEIPELQSDKKRLATLKKSGRCC